MFSIGRSPTNYYVDILELKILIFFCVTFLIQKNNEPNEAFIDYAKYQIKNNLYKYDIELFCTYDTASPILREIL